MLPDVRALGLSSSISSKSAAGYLHPRSSDLDQMPCHGERTSKNPFFDPYVARPINDKLKRQTRTLGQALGFVVTQLRVKKKWSQGDLARKSGFEITTINRLERGKANPMALVIVMADTFGLRPSQLLSRAEQKSMKHVQTGPS